MSGSETTTTYKPEQPWKAAKLLELQELMEDPRVYRRYHRACAPVRMTRKNAHMFNCRCCGRGLRPGRYVTLCTQGQTATGRPKDIPIGNYCLVCVLSIDITYIPETYYLPKECLPTVPPCNNVEKKSGQGTHCATSMSDGK